MNWREQASYLSLDCSRLVWLATSVANVINMLIIQSKSAGWLRNIDNSLVFLHCAQRMQEPGDLFAELPLHLGIA